MTITYDWHIPSLEHEAADGYVFTAHWTVTATDSETNSEGVAVTADSYGSLWLERPDNLIPYEALTEETVINWVKDELGTEQVERIKASLASKIAEQKNPFKRSGTPW